MALSPTRGTAYATMSVSFKLSIGRESGSRRRTRRGAHEAFIPHATPEEVSLRFNSISSWTLFMPYSQGDLRSSETSTSTSGDRRGTLRASGAFRASLESADTLGLNANRLFNCLRQGHVICAQMGKAAHSLGTAGRPVRAGTRRHAHNIMTSM